MKIYKDNDNLFIKSTKGDITTIPLLQDSFDALYEHQGQVSNVIGMIDGKDLGFAQVVDLGYKNSFDYGDFIVKLKMSREKFKKLCDKLDLICFEWPACHKCGHTIYGCHTVDKYGESLCFDCDKDE